MAGVFNIIIGAGMLIKGHPSGLFFIASGATAFGQSNGWQIASTAFAVAAVASSGVFGGPGGEFGSSDGQYLAGTGGEMGMDPVSDEPIRVAGGPLLLAYQLALRAQPHAQRGVAQAERASRAIGTRINHLKEHLTREDLVGALGDLKGNPVVKQYSGVAWQHLKEVQDAQRGLLVQIDRLNNLLSYPQLGSAQRVRAQHFLSEASKLLDQSEGFVPR